MIQNILTIFVLLFLLYSFCSLKEHMGNDNNFKYLNNSISYFVQNNIYSNNELIELEKLPSCTKIINVDYGTNSNVVVNNNISIYQNTIDPLLHTIEIDNVNYNLINIAWKRSKFSYNNKEVGLDLHLIHQNYNSVNKIVIIIPLDLINDNLTTNNINESFANVGYIKMEEYPNQIETNSLFTQQYENSLLSTPIIKSEMDIINLHNKKESLKNKYNLNTNNSDIIINNLFTNELFIPNYKCCSDNIGSELNFNFYNIKNIILKNQLYYQLEDHNNNIYYICPPMKFPENIGLDIREKIIDDVNIRYLKEKKIDI